MDSIDTIKLMQLLLSLPHCKFHFIIFPINLFRNFSRVSSPLVFNFLQMLQINNTAFHAVMGNVKFATSFMTYFPVLLVVLILCNVFDIYGRVLDNFGLKRFKFNEESTNEKIEEGKKLLLKGIMVFIMRLKISSSNS